MDGLGEGLPAATGAQAVRIAGACWGGLAVHRNGILAHVSQAGAGSLRRPQAVRIAGSCQGWAG